MTNLEEIIMVVWFVVSTIGTGISVANFMGYAQQPHYLIQQPLAGK